MPTNYPGRVLLILAVLIISIVMILPPGSWFDSNLSFGQKLALKPGIDMVGGTSLLYEIKTPDGSQTINGANLAEQVMESLKKRVDPDGVRNLIWRPQGATRLEIQMPLSGKNKDTGKKRAEYAAAQSALDATNVRPQAVLDAVEKSTGPDRQQKLTALAMGSAKRTQLYTDLAQTWDALQKAKSSKDAAAQADAEIRYDKLRAQIAETNIPVSDLEERLADALKYGDPATRQKKYDEINAAIAASITSPQPWRRR